MLSIIILTYNRLSSLKNCLTSIICHTKSPYEIIVVNNNSNDGTKEFLANCPSIKTLNLDQNYGVIARNRGFKIAKGEFIVQIDDDVVVHNGWDKVVLNCFKEDNVGMAGPQGGLITPNKDNWLNTEVFKHNNGYVDFLTGFFMCFRNIGLKYNEEFGFFWHEEMHLSLQFKEAGYKLKLIQDPVCCHISQRIGPIDWDLHNRNLQYVYDEWKDKQDILRLGGN